MRSLVLLSAILLLVAAFIGCSGESSSDKGGTHDEATVENEATTDVAGEATEAMALTRDEFVTKSEAKLEDVAKNITEWKSSINELPAPAKTAATGSMEALEGAQATATEAVGKVKSAGEEEWEQYKPAADQAMNELDGAVEKVKALF